jgi:hypothetical protein
MSTSERPRPASIPPAPAPLGFVRVSPARSRARCRDCVNASPHRTSYVVSWLVPSTAQLEARTVCDDRLLALLRELVP